MEDKNKDQTNKKDGGNDAPKQEANGGKPPVPIKPKEIKKEIKQKPKEQEINADQKDTFEDYKSEFKKIVWPTRPEIAKKTVTVIVMSAVISTIIFSMDTVLATGYESVMRAMGKIPEMQLPSITTDDGVFQITPDMIGEDGTISFPPEMLEGLSVDDSGEGLEVEGLEVEGLEVEDGLFGEELLNQEENWNAEESGEEMPSEEGIEGEILEEGEGLAEEEAYAEIYVYEEDSEAIEE